MASPDVGEQLRKKITVAHVEAEKLKDRLRAERDRLADTSRKLSFTFYVVVVIVGDAVFCSAPFCFALLCYLPGCACYCWMATGCYTMLYIHYHVC